MMQAELALSPSGNGQDSTLVAGGGALRWGWGAGGWGDRGWTRAGGAGVAVGDRGPGGGGPRGAVGRSENERAERGRSRKAAEQKTKWLSAAPRRAAKAATPPEEPSPIVRMLRSVFGCGCGGR